MNLRQRTFAAALAGVALLCCTANFSILQQRTRDDIDTPAVADAPRFVSRGSDEFLPESLREQYAPEPPVEMGNKKIVVNVGMPRTGTNTWVMMMRKLYAHDGEFYRIYDKYAPEDLAELLLMGNRSTIVNPLRQALTRPPEGSVRALADHPSFLLAPIAKDFPNVYWVQVSRELEPHINSTVYMLQKWCQDRCACAAAPRCSTGNMALIDRLYFDRFHAMRYMCENKGNAERIPRDLLRTWLGTHEEETTRHLQGHPRWLRLRLEDGARANAGKMARFLGLDEGVLEGLDFDAFHANKRKPRLKQVKIIGRGT